MVMIDMIFTAGEGFESISKGYIDSLSLSVLSQYIALQLLCLSQFQLHSIKIIDFARAGSERFVM